MKIRAGYHFVSGRAEVNGPQFSVDFTDRRLCWQGSWLSSLFPSSDQSREIPDIPQILGRFESHIKTLS